MEQDGLHSIAVKVYEAMAEASWREKSLDEIETQVQQKVNQVAQRVLQDYILPRRIQEIQEQVQGGQIRCGGCGAVYQRHKRDQAIHPQTIFGGKIEVKRDQYYCRRCPRYVMVADEALGMVGHQMTPRLAAVVALCGASWSYQVAAAFLLFLFGVGVSAKTVQNITGDERLKPAALESDALDRPPGVVTMDGDLIRGREPKRWLEMKVGSFFSHVVPVSQGRNEVLDASFVAGAMAEWKDFVEPVRQEARRRGLSHSDAVEFVADGAAGIWDLQEWVFPQARPRLDQYHTKRKIGERLRQAYSRLVRANHESFIQQSVEQGLAHQAIDYLQHHRPRSGAKREACDKLIGYLQRHQQHLPHYAQVKAARGTVSSGLMEKANDLIVGRRLKLGPMHWTRAGAEPILEHRTAFINKHARTRTGPYDLAFCCQPFQ